MSSDAEGKPRSRKIAGSLPVGCLVLLCVFFSVAASCSRDASSKTRIEDPRKNTAVPVTAGIAAEKTVPVQLRAIGNVQAFSTVVVKAQVQGELTGVHFSEGREVKKGERLFTIDSRSYEAKLRLAEAALARDRAQLANARKQVERYGSVVKKGYVAEEQFDTIKANFDALEASVRADEATVENARLDLSFCTISSPIDGVTGGLRVNRGNIIKMIDNDKPLVTINQVDPVYVVFSIPERNLPRVKQHMADRRLAVEADIPADAALTATGELTFIENEVDVNTGTIQMKATFPNTDRKLWPGQFVNVTVTLASQAGKTVVPSRAIQFGQAGQYVFVIQADMKAEYRPVTVGSRLDEEVVIEKGVAPGEKVVTDGHLQLKNGSLVKLVNGPEKGGEGKSQ